MQRFFLTPFPFLYVHEIQHNQHMNTHTRSFLNNSVAYIVKFNSLWNKISHCWSHLCSTNCSGDMNSFMTLCHNFFSFWNKRSAQYQIVKNPLKSEFLGHSFLVACSNNKSHCGMIIGYSYQSKWVIDNNDCLITI